MDGSELSLLQTLLMRYISEDELTKQINSCLNLDELKEMLKIKYHFISLGLQQPVNYTIHSLITQLKYSKIVHHSEALKYALLIQPDSCELESLSNILNKSTECCKTDVNDLTFIFGVLDVLLWISENSVFTVDFNKFSNLPTLYNISCKVSSKELMPFINIVSTKLLSKLNSHLLLRCFDAVIASSNIKMFCCLIDHFLKCDYKKELLDLIHKSDLWSKINILINSSESVAQRQGTFLLQQIKTFVTENNLFSETASFYIYRNNSKTKAITSAWNTFFVLLDVSREKQIHLVKPSLKLLPDVLCLHPLWVETVYRILLFHSQNEVVLLAAKSLIASKWFEKFEHFSSMCRYLLIALNKSDYSEIAVEVFSDMSCFVRNCDVELFWLMLKECVKIRWNPINMWMFCKSVLYAKRIAKIHDSVICEFLVQLQALPHKYIRRGCMHLCVKFVGNIDMSYQVLQKIGLTVYNLDSLLFSASCDHLNTVINNHKESLEKDILDWQGCRINSSLQSKVILQFWKILDKEGNIFSTYNFSKIAPLLFFRILNTFDFLIQRIDATVVFGKLESLLECCEGESEDIELVIKKISDDVSYRNANSDKILHLCLLAENVVLQNSADTKPFENKIALNVAKHFHNSLNFWNMWTEHFKIADIKTEMVFVDFLDLLFDDLNKDTVLDVLDCIYEKGSDRVVVAAVKKLSCVLRNVKNVEVVCKILEGCFQQILKLQRGELFKSAIEECLKLIVEYQNVFFVDEVALKKCYDIIQLVLELSHTYTFVGPILNRHVREFVESYPNDSRFYADVIIECLLNDACIKQEERNEYDVCKDIFSTTGWKINNGSSKFLLIESLLILTNKHATFADDFATMLIAKYKINFNKRYFKDSLIHIQKLRILQTCLLLEPHLTTSKGTLMQLMLTSIATESHQRCVKQYMEWLLIRLLAKDDEGRKIVTSVLKYNTRSQVSKISAFILILYHMTTKTGSEAVWLETIEYLLPWTMGANFKLRVYAQTAIKKLYEKVSGVAEKYQTIYSCITTMMMQSEEEVRNALSSDQIIFDVFDPEGHFSLETILVEIPKMNSVANSEWEDYASVEFPNCVGIKGRNSSKELSEAVDDFKKKIEYTFKKTDESKNSEVLQRKITPWRELFENKQLLKLTNVVLVASFVEKTANIGGLSRTCEIFGVKQLVVQDVKIVHDKEYKSLSMSSEGWLNITEVKERDIKEYLWRMKAENYQIVAAEQTSDSVLLHDYKFVEKTVLLLGNEKQGVPCDILPFADFCVQIPQMGVTRSLNVHVAGALFIWEYCKQHSIK